MKKYLYIRPVVTVQDLEKHLKVLQEQFRAQDDSCDSATCEPSFPHELPQVENVFYDKETVETGNLLSRLNHTICSTTLQIPVYIELDADVLLYKVQKADGAIRSRSLSFIEVASPVNLVNDKSTWRNSRESKLLHDINLDLAEAKPKD